jgi:hypothetical protein
MGPAQETRSVYRVGLPLQDGLEEAREFGRIVFKIGILDHDDIPGCRRKPSPESRPLSTILRLEEESVHESLSCETSQNVARSIRGPVIHHNDFGLEWEFTNPPQQPFDRAGFVITRNDDRENHESGSPSP